ncbi:hypothetical protein IW262DRAFT_1364527 [Armillaria fumosa]|nr:hypothetical protein IW262DRAFT_1364527 [Armillaria fumosa]
MSQKRRTGNHKPFCRSGAPYFVIDVGDSSLSSNIGGSTRNDAFQVPIRMPDGNTTMSLSSSTISADSPKEVRNLAHPG